MAEINTQHSRWIDQAVAQADTTVLRAALYYLTRDERLIDIPMGVEPTLIGEMPAITDDAARAKIRNDASDFLHSSPIRTGECSSSLDREQLRKVMSLCAGEEIGDDYVDLNREEMGLDPDGRSMRWRRPPCPAQLEKFRVLVIGAGMGGICAAVRLQQAGISFVVIEKNSAVGGTWFENAYPDARVDVPSQWYSYSFEVEYPWTHAFATQAEIQTYLMHCVEKYAVRDKIRLGTEVVSARWSDAERQWQVRVRCGDREELLEANTVISAVGMLNRPLYPEIDGLGDFSGRIFHTSRWDPSFKLAGKRVSLIGTGASGMQVGPRIASEVDSLAIFQRSPSWVFPVPGYREPMTPEIAWICGHLPTYRQWLRFRISHAFGDRIHEFFRIDPEWKDAASLNRSNAFLRDRCIEHLRRELDGRPDLIWKCMPDYPPMVKRFVVDNGWYAALRRKNVELVTDPIRRITRKGIITSGGREYRADLIVLATGFQANRPLWPMEIVGRSGTTLEELWSKDGPRAYLGITMPSFPNFFCLYGPNTNPRQGGVCTMLECQVRYALGCIRALIEGEGRSIECRQEVYDAFNEKLDAHLRSTIWMHETQNSYYMNRFGRVATNSPWRLLDYWRWTREPNLDDFLLR